MFTSVQPPPTNIIITADPLHDFQVGDILMMGEWELKHYYRWWGLVLISEWVSPDYVRITAVDGKTLVTKEKP